MDPEASEKPVRTLALLAFCAFVVVACGSLRANDVRIPLAFIGSLADGGDWYTLGANIATDGVFGYGPDAMVHRAPGYPFFVGLILKWAAGEQIHDKVVRNTLGLPALIHAQSLLLGLCSALLFLWLARRLRLSTAFVAALVFGLNPYSLAIAGLVHYDVLHWTLILAFLLAMDVAARRESPGGFLLAGFVLGLATLVRPLTLIAPVFLLVPFLRGASRSRTSLRGFGSIMLGFVAVLAPWTMRNFQLTDRVIPVNAQSWTAIFGSTMEMTDGDPDRYHWFTVMASYMEIYSRVTGETVYRPGVYQRHVVDLEDAARSAAIKNIEDSPGIYLSNAVRSAANLVFRVNANLLTVWARTQQEDFQANWILAGRPGHLERGAEANIFEAFHDLLLIAAIFGLIHGFRLRDPFLAFPVALAITMLIGHSIAYMDFFYYYVKLPFLVAFACYGLDMLPRSARILSLCSLLVLALSNSQMMRLFI